MLRALIMTFHVERRWEPDVHPHESPKIMTVPLVILGALSLVGGYLLVLNGGVEHWLAPSVGATTQHASHTINTTLLGALAIVVMVIGAGIAWLFFGRRPVPATQPVAVSPITVAARKNLYGDAFNEAVLMRPGQWLSRALVYFDNRGVDGAVNGLGASFGGSSGRLKRIQTGFVRSYALSMLGGGLAVVIVLLAVRFQ
jgi:NADH-quinone oxidoreductase subunit L